MSQIKTTELEGDVAIGRHVTAGGNAAIQGNTTVKKNLKVEGWLDAPNIKGPRKGLFKTAETLNAAYPRPHDGWWALVGPSLPAQLYLAEGGEWLAQEDDDGNAVMAGSLTIDWEQYHEDYAELSESLQGIAQQATDNATTLQGYGTRLTNVESSIDKRGVAGGFASLDEDGYVPVGQLPPSSSRVVSFKEVYNGMLPETSIEAATASGGDVVFVTSLQCFVCRVPNTGGLGYKYYGNWGGAEEYGTSTVHGYSPASGKLYISSPGEVYLWDGEKLVGVTSALKAALGGVSLRFITAEEDEGMLASGTHDSDTLYFIAED